MRSATSGEENPLLVNQREKVALLEKMIEAAEHNAFRLPKDRLRPPRRQRRNPDAS
jgi:hypothetical protein